MPENHTDDVARAKDRLERFRLSNADLSQQLSDALRRSQRLASSLGFRDIYEAQAAIDTADSDLSYWQCFEELETLRAQVRDLTAQRDNALARMKRLEEQRQSRPPSVSGGVRICDLVPDEIAVDILPYALRLAYCELSGLRQSDVDELPAEGAIRMYEMMDPGLDILQKNAKIVREWEDIFSFRKKDRRSKVSRLTIVESFRFQRSLYRIMLVSWLYGMGSIPESDMEDEDYPYSDKYQARQTKFLMQYPTDDLFEINHVIRTIIFVGHGVMVRDSVCLDMRDVYDWDGLFLFGGPSYIMDAYHNREADADEDIRYGGLFRYLFDDGPASEFLTCALEHILETRTGDKSDLNFKQRILDYVEGADDPCVQCNCHSDITPLRNKTTWDDIVFIWVFRDLEGFLSQSVGIKYPETKFFFNEIEKVSTRQLMEEVFELRQVEYASWKPEDWVCLDCWTSLIYRTIPTWWAERRPQQIWDSEEK